MVKGVKCEVKSKQDMAGASMLSWSTSKAFFVKVPLQEELQPT